MKNSVSTNEAAKLVRRAVKEGWERSIDVMRDSTGRPWSIQVNLFKYLYFENGELQSGAQIIVSFHLSGCRRRSVRVASRYHFQDGMKAGWWSANYHLNEMETASKRNEEFKTAKV